MRIIASIGAEISEKPKNYFCKLVLSVKAIYFITPKTKCIEAKVTVKNELSHKFLVGFQH